MISGFRDVKVGDVVTRLLAGKIPMRFKVSDVDENFIYCGGPEGWKFDRDTGAEVDEELNWGNSGTGSYLVMEDSSVNDSNV